MHVTFTYVYTVGKTGDPRLSFLKLVISRPDVSCEDSAHYRCQMETIMADGSVKTYIKDMQISISGKTDLLVVSIIKSARYGCDSFFSFHAVTSMHTLVFNKNHLSVCLSIYFSPFNSSFFEDKLS